MMKRTKRRILAVSLIILGVTLLAFGGYLLHSWWHATYYTFQGQTLRWEDTHLDLHGQDAPDLQALEALTHLRSLDITGTGITTEQYQQLQQALPDCAITWSVPFQDTFIPNSETVIAVSSLSKEDIAALAFFPALKTVDATAVTEQDILLTLRRQRPDLLVTYDVHIGNVSYDHAKQQLSLADITDAEINDLIYALAHMQQLEKLAFVGQLPKTEQLIKLKKSFPNVMFIWDFELFGLQVNTLDTELILNDIPVDSIETVAAAMDCFYNMEKVEMCHCGIPSEQMAQLRDRFPNTKFVWTVKLGWAEVRTDITTFMPYQLGFWGGRFENRYAKELKYCTDIICMDLGHQKISDLSFLNYMPNMQYLLLCEVPAQDFSMLAGLTELKYLELFLTSFTDASLLSNMTKLEDLNICYTGVRDFAPIMELPNLKHLWMNGAYRMNRRTLNEMIEAMPNTVIRYGYGGSTEGGWRETPNYYAQRDLLGMNYMVG